MTKKAAPEAATAPLTDNDPRAGQPEHSNRVDFNDPSLSGSEAVERALSAQDEG